MFLDQIRMKLEARWVIYACLCSSKFELFEKKQQQKLFIHIPIVKQCPENADPYKKNENDNSMTIM